MKRPTGKLLFLLFAAVSFFACNFASPTTAPATETGTSSTLSPAVTPTSIPPTASPPTQTPDPNAKTVTLDNISFVIPSPLAQAATAKQVAAVTSNKSKPWLIAPAHIQITLSGYRAPKGSYLLPQIFIYPAQDYASANQTANANLGKLKTILANPLATANNQSVPWLPYTPGEQSIAAQTKVIDFKNGSGVRMVTQYDIFLDPVVTAPGDPIVNRLLFYHFEGLSSDGTTYIVAVLPLESPILADSPAPNAEVPSGGVPYPGLGTDIAHFDYFQSVTDQLNAQSADSFSPSLNLLDALMASITITP